jgi:two-component system LytT family response regulator
MTSLRCAVVEDEPEARASLRRWLAAEGCEVVGEAASGGEAVTLLDDARPELVFLDVRIPEIDGIQVLQRARHRPEVVFTTAYESHAVAAFELGAVDYLVKPFGRARLAAALARVRQRKGEGGPPGADRALAASDRPLRWIYARSRGRIVPVPVAEVVRIDAAGEYSEVHAGGESHLVRVPLRDLLALLDPGVFEQVHRCHVVHLGAVADFRPHDDRRLLVTLKDGSSVVASRSASERLRRRAR